MVKIFTKGVDSENNLILDGAINLRFLNDFPVEEEELLDPVVWVHLQVCQHIHQESRVVLVVGNDLDQGHQGLLFLDESTSLESGDEVGVLWCLDHGVIVYDKVAGSDLVFNWHLAFSFSDLIYMIEKN